MISVHLLVRLSPEQHRQFEARLVALRQRYVAKQRALGPGAGSRESMLTLPNLLRVLIIYGMEHVNRVDDLTLVGYIMKHGLSVGRP